jgi:hypothetical protein
MELLLSYIGNLIPVPFILIGIGWVMNRLQQIPAVHAWLEDKAAKGVLWLSEKLYPDLYEDLDVAAEADKYYKEFFGVTYSDIVNSASDNAAK